MEIMSSNSILCFHRYYILSIIIVLIISTRVESFVSLSPISTITRLNTKSPIPIRSLQTRTDTSRPHNVRQQSKLYNQQSEASSGSFKTYYKEIQVPTLKGISFHDISPALRQAVEESGVRNGVVYVLTKHTTTAITINEMEGRLVDDARQFLLKLAPPLYPYLHNDIHLRSGPPGWEGGDEAWRAQEPQNCHSHLLSMLIGTDANIPIHDKVLKIGTWQSVILVELDGPRTRSVAIQVQGS